MTKFIINDRDRTKKIRLRNENNHFHHHSFLLTIMAISSKAYLVEICISLPLWVVVGTKMTVLGSYWYLSLSIYLRLECIILTRVEPRKTTCCF